MKLLWFCCTCSNDFNERYSYWLMSKHFAPHTSSRRDLSLIIVPSPSPGVTSLYCSCTLTKSRDTTIIDLTLSV